MKLLLIFPTTVNSENDYQWKREHATKIFRKKDAENVKEDVYKDNIQCTRKEC